MDWAVHIRRIFARIGEDATVIGATSPSVRGMFLAPYERIALGLGPGVVSSNPRFAAITADLPASPTAVVTTRGTHSIKEVQADDPGGFTVFELHET